MVMQWHRGGRARAFNLLLLQPGGACMCGAGEGKARQPIY